MGSKPDNRTRACAAAAALLCASCLGGCSAGRGHGGFSAGEVGEVIGSVGLWLGAAAGLMAAQSAGGDPENGSDYLFRPENEWPDGRW